MATFRCDRIVTAPAPNGVPNHVRLASHEVVVVNGECVGQCHAFFPDAYEGVRGMCLDRLFRDSGLNPNPVNNPCRLTSEIR